MRFLGLENGFNLEKPGYSAKKCNLGYLLFISRNFTRITGPLIRVRDMKNFLHSIIPSLRLEKRKRKKERF